MSPGGGRTPLSERLPVLSGADYCEEISQSGLAKLPWLRAFFVSTMK